MGNAQCDCGCELPRSIGPGEHEALAPLGVGEDGRARGRVVVDSGDPAVLRVDVEEQLVIDVQDARRRGTLRLEANDGIRAVGVIGDEQVAKANRAPSAVRGHGQTIEGERGDLWDARANLAPRDVPSAVPVESEDVVQVAQRHVPATLDAGLSDGQTQVAVAGLVRERRGGAKDAQRERCQRDRETKRRAAHGFTGANFATSASIRGSCSPCSRTNATASAAAAGERAASADSSTI